MEAFIIEKENSFTVLLGECKEKSESNGPSSSAIAEETEVTSPLLPQLEHTRSTSSINIPQSLLLLPPPSPPLPHPT